jgi:septal ring factor EnvC (AmiA/AmiB activator)
LAKFQIAYKNKLSNQPASHLQEKMSHKHSRHSSLSLGSSATFALHRTRTTPHQNLHHSQPPPNSLPHTISERDELIFSSQSPNKSHQPNPLNQENPHTPSQLQTLQHQITDLKKSITHLSEQLTFKNLTIETLKDYKYKFLDLHQKSSSEIDAMQRRIETLQKSETNQNFRSLTPTPLDQYSIAQERLNESFRDEIESLQTRNINHSQIAHKNHQKIALLKNHIWDRDLTIKTLQKMSDACV